MEKTKKETKEEVKYFFPKYGVLARDLKEAKKISKLSKKNNE